MLSFRQTRNLGLGVLFLIIFVISLFSYLSHYKTIVTIKTVLNVEAEKLNKWMEVSNLISDARAFKQIRGTIRRNNDNLISEIDKANHFLIFGLFTGLCLVIFVMIILGRSLGNPLSKLSLAMQKIAEGNLSYRLDLVHDRDIGKLAESFNKMAGDLKKFRDHLLSDRDYIEKILNSMNDMVFVVSSDGKIKTINSSVCTVLGYGRDELLGRGIGMILKEEVKFNEITPVGREKACFSKGGKRIPVFFSTSVMSEDSAGFKEIVCVAKDLTGIKETEGELRRNFQFQAVLNSILGLSLLDIPMDELSRFALQQILTMPWLSGGAIFLVEEDKPDVLLMTAQEGIPAEMKKLCLRVPFGSCVCGRVALNKQIRFSNSNDSDHEIRYDGMPFHSHYCVPIVFGEKTIGVLNMYVKEDYSCQENEKLFFRMISHTLAEIIMRKQAEKGLREAYRELSLTQSQLVQTAKMASIGQLAGGVAHEINNPLTGVLNNVQLIKMMSASTQNFDSKDFKELLDVIEESALRCKKITESLLDFSHASMGNFHAVSLNIVIEKIIGLINNEMKLQSIDVKKELEPSLPDVQGDPQLLQQVIVNLISNAKWAIEKKFGKSGGCVTLKSMFDADSKTVQVHISDNGIGIPDEKINKIFEPFFTTKQVGVGTGLGLYIVSNIIRKHRGTITVESSPGQGATFKMSLPVSQL